MLELSYLLIFMLLGAFMGVCSGLLGVGGALIINPLVWYLFKQGGAADPIPTTSATMLLAIFFNACLSARKHHHQKTILWEYAPYIMIGALLGAVTGPQTMDLIDRELLRKKFGVLQVLAGAYIIWKTRLVEAERAPVRFPSAALLGMGFLSGFVASLIGIGGGVITVPMLFLACRLPMKNAVGISTAVMVCTSLFGAGTWVVKGWSTAGIPEPHLGYVFFPASLAMAALGMVTAWKSAAKIKQVNQKALQIALAVMMFLSGINLTFGISEIIKARLGVG